MRKIFMYMLALCAMLSMNSCIKEEPLNAECDIEKVTLSVDDPESVFYQLTDITKEITSTTTLIEWEVKPDADITNIIPIIETTPGSTVSPASGVAQDFSKGSVFYVVTSQDGNWTRRYEISIKHHIEPVVNDVIKYDFENFELEESRNKYYIWYNLLEDGSKAYDWASGNGGFQLSMGTAAPVDYPTVPGIGEGMDGTNCIKLTTRSTGTFGAMVNKRIAAGNFFIGEFDITSALKDAMKATRFGKPFTSKPEKYMGFYKYTPGEKYQDKNGKEVAGMVDNGSNYAVFYRNHDDDGNEVFLYGDDVQTSPYIVAIAKVANMHAATEWTAFEEEFEYHKEVDEELLKNRGYSFTVVFSSSVNGDLFEGAVGSQLMVDKVRVICPHKK